MNEPLKRRLAPILTRLGLLRLSKALKCLLVHIRDANDNIRHLGGINPKELTYRLATLTLMYHRIEKGLCMPQFRSGFGQDNVWQTIHTVQALLMEGQSSAITEIHSALSALHEYREVHRRIGHSLPSALESALAEITNASEYTKLQQWEMTSQSYWANTEASFPVFAASRHSVRDFSGKVDSSLIDQSIALACTAPTACNRQHVHIHTYEDDKASALLAYQNGNRGFGHLCKQLIVVTADKNALYTIQERHDTYTNGGIFAMNLSYSLHYHHVAHCMLNWSTEPGVDKAFRAVAGIPENETIVLLIACGQVPEKFKVARSLRKPVSAIHTRH